MMSYLAVICYLCFICCLVPLIQANNNDNNNTNNNIHNHASTVNDTNELLDKFYPPGRSELNLVYHRIKPRNESSYDTSSPPSSSLIQKNITWKPVNCKVFGLDLRRNAIVAKTPWAYVISMYASNESSKNYTAIVYRYIRPYTNILSLYQVAHHSVLDMPLCVYPIGSPGFVFNDMNWMSVEAFLTNQQQVMPMSTTYQSRVHHVARQLMSFVSHVHELGFSIVGRTLPELLVTKAGHVKVNPATLLVLPLCRRLFPNYRLNAVEFQIPLLANRTAARKASNRRRNNPQSKYLKNIAMPQTTEEMFFVAYNHTEIDLQPIEYAIVPHDIKMHCEIGFLQESYSFLVDQLVSWLVLPMIGPQSDMQLLFNLNGYVFPYMPNNTQTIAEIGITRAMTNKTVIPEPLRQVIYHMTIVVQAGIKSKCPHSLATCFDTDKVDAQLSLIQHLPFWRDIDKNPASSATFVNDII